MRDEEWANRYYREYEERDDDICEAELAAAAVAAGDDDELLRELEDSTAQGGTCSDGTLRGNQGDEREAQGRGEKEGGPRVNTYKRNKAVEDERSGQQHSSREGDRKPVTSRGEVETVGERRSETQKKRSKDYKANKGRKGKGKRE